MRGEWRCKVVSIRRLRLLHPHIYDISSSFSFLPVVHSDPTTCVRLVDTFSELRVSAQHTVSRLQNNKSFSPLLPLVSRFLASPPRCFCSVHLAMAPVSAETSVSRAAALPLTLAFFSCSSSYSWQALVWLWTSLEPLDLTCLLPSFVSMTERRAVSVAQQK